MIDLTTLSRIRFRGGTVVHSVTVGSMRTGCGQYARLEDLRGRRVDEPMPDRTAVTCRGCTAAAKES